MARCNLLISARLRGGAVSDTSPEALADMAASALRQIVLGKDVVMPSLGFGAGTAWFKAEGDKPVELKRAIKAALDAGFRHIDDAEMYQNTGLPPFALSTSASMDGSGGLGQR